MKIVTSELEAIDKALKALANINVPGARIDQGSYKGGLYDCYYIIHPLTGNELFAIAY